MKRVLLSLLTIITMCLNTHAQQNEKSDANASKTLVAYFSATGTTAEAAKQLSKVTGGELYRITPKTAYTSADLDWHNKQSRSSVEMNDPKSRPALKGKKENIADYDVIYIGYPIWWGVAPPIIKTFIDSHPLKGKTVIPFATSGGSAIGKSVEDLKKTYPDLNWKEGMMLNRATEGTIREALRTIQMIKEEEE